MNKYDKKLDKGIKILEEINKTGNEHRDISKEHKDNSMGKKEQRFWIIITIIVGLGISGVIIVFLYNLINNDNSNSSIKIDVYPNKIKLNEGRDIDFNINFTNIGKENLSNFNIFKISLYRIEDGKPVYQKEILSLSDNKNVWCDNFGSYYGYQLNVGKKCYSKFKLYSCPNCFDDKDKIPQLYIYIESSPPIENQIFNLSIY